MYAEKRSGRVSTCDHHQAAERVSCKHRKRRPVAFSIRGITPLDEIRTVVSPPLVGLAFHRAIGSLHSPAASGVSRVRSVWRCPPRLSSVHAGWFLPESDSAAKSRGCVRGRPSSKARDKRLGRARSPRRSHPDYAVLTSVCWSDHESLRGASQV